MDATASDADLVRRTMQGDTEAFHQLTVRYYRPVAGFILKRVQRPDMVEDLVQETFLEALQALKAGRGPEKFSSWLFGIAHNRCGKWLRRKRPVLFSPHDAPEIAAAPSEQALRESCDGKTTTTSKRPSSCTASTSATSHDRRFRYQVPYTDLS